MTSKPKKQGKASKPDCKVWAQVGDELLPEYLNKPIDGVEGQECWLVVAPGDHLSVYCQAKPGILDEYVLVVDGVIRGCEVRRNTTVVFDKALDRAPGRATQLGAVFRSDMVIQPLNKDESKIAEADEKLSKVGSIIIEGWSKVEDPLSTTEKAGGSLSFPTYDNSRHWYDASRFVDPSPGQLPPFEVGFNHGENRCDARSGVRTRALAAGTRNTAEWKLSHKYVFNLRSATELHQLGQTDVPVRNPKTDFFAEDHEQNAKGDENQVVNMASDDDDEEPEESEEATYGDDEAKESGEEILEKKEDFNQKTNDKSEKKSEDASMDKTLGPSKENPKPKTDEGNKASSEKTKPKSKTKTVEENKNSSEKTNSKPKSKTEPMEKSSEKSKDKTKQNTSNQVVEPSTQKKTKSKESITEAAASGTPKKKALYGLKSAPAFNASRIRSLSMEGAKVSEISLTAQDQEQGPKSTDKASTSFLVTPPPSIKKSESFSDPAEAKRLLLPAPKGIRPASEPRACDMSLSHKVTFLNDGGILRAVSEGSEFPTEADPVELQFISQSSSAMPEAGNHTEASPILGSPSRSFSNTQPDDENEIDQLQGLEMESQYLTSQPRQEISNSFRTPSVDKCSFLAVSFQGGQSPFTQPESFVGKRKAGGNTGNGIVEEAARPRKTSIAPASRSIMESLRRQQEENDRLEQRLEDLRQYNATLENIRELKKKSQSVQDKINEEEARQAVLEAELRQ